MAIRYTCDQTISETEFKGLLQRSTLAERRPVDDPECIAAMLKHTNLLCTAWSDDKLAGVARSITDFAYCCYLSDLAVDVEFQHQGIGRELIRLTQSRLGDRAKIILLAAPKAAAYYPKLGFQSHSSAWILPARQPL
jgi:ribosomal protein S18 acetylase RimI-like enzyme